MTEVLLNDCPPQIVKTLTDILKDSATVTAEPYNEQTEITGYNLVILYAEPEDDKTVLSRIKGLHLRTKFRNIPIILLKDRAELFSGQPYVNFGASEFMAMDDPPPVFRQILQGYLTAGRKPLEREMVYLTPFIKSTQKVITTMAGIEAKFKEVYFKNNLRIFGDVSGILGLSGAAEGTVVVTFRWHLAQKVIARIMSVEENEIDAEMIHDGVGEIINMVSGSAKKTLCQLGYNFQLSVPTVIVGWGHEAGYPETATIAVLLFDIGEESFVVNVSLSQRA